MRDLIGRRERIITQLESDISGTFNRLERSLYLKLIEVLSLMDSDGDNVRFTARNADVLLRFRTDVSQYLRDNAGISSISQSLRRLTDASVSISEAVTGIASNTSTLTAIQETFANIVTDRVFGAADLLKSDFAVILFRHIGLGTTKSQVIREFRSLLDGSDAIRYAQQLATDAIYQYDGTVQKHLADELNLDAFMFVGSLIETSREGCIHMVNAPKPVEICKGNGEKRKCINKENRFKDIFLQSGGFKIDDIPFIIEMNENDSGWNPETNKENYLSLRNGYNCRHQIVTYKMGRDEASVNKLLQVYES